MGEGVGRGVGIAVGIGVGVGKGVAVGKRVTAAISTDMWVGDGVTTGEDAVFSTLKRTKNVKSRSAMAIPSVSRVNERFEFDADIHFIARLRRPANRRKRRQWIDCR